MATTTKSRKPRTPRIPKVVDLHNPEVPVAGRVDVLAARLLRLAVDRVQDPVLKAIYDTLQPSVDTVFLQRLGSLDCASLFRQIGLAPPVQINPKTKAGPKRKRRSRVVMP